MRGEEERNHKIRERERRGGGWIRGIPSSPRFALYTNYKIVVSDYCQPHHTESCARRRARVSPMRPLTLGRVVESHSSGRLEFLSRRETTAARRMGRLIGAGRRRRRRRRRRQSGGRGGQ